jgi:hypothetical protein
MSTKTSIKSSVHTDDQPGFHRLVDLLNDFGAADGAPEPPVYLRIDGVSCRRRTKFEPPCRPNIEPGVEADFERVGCG